MVGKVGSFCRSEVLYLQKYFSSKSLIKCHIYLHPNLFQKATRIK